MSPRHHLSPGMIAHEGQPLLSAGRRLKGSLGPGGRIELLAEEEPPTKKKCRLACACLVLFGIILLACSMFKTLHGRPDKVQNPQEFTEEWKLHCDDDIFSFERETVRVSEGQTAFPSFWDYAPYGPISVSYDERALLLNGTRSLFLSGSMHPARSTPSSWSNALDEAVRHGLNMITIYVFWASHQPFEGTEMDWSLPGRACDKFGDDIDEATIPCGWTLASAIRAAANRGLFVHARIGPYVCAEYSYGGIPEWVPLNKPEMSMRRPNKPWMDAMEIYVQSTIEYLTKEKLWAYQGGPIIMGQIENELGGEVDAETENLITIEACDKMPSISSSYRLRNATLQDYAHWSGAIAAKYAPKVLWTMCNGLTAPNAINTCNGFGGASCSDVWLESHGQSGRIQVDQPALWTENEAGFQVWGETADKPTDYFWGRTARRNSSQLLHVGWILQSRSFSCCGDHQHVRTRCQWIMPEWPKTPANLWTFPVPARSYY
jgi:Glycosyl hydrolases family 35